MKLNARFAAGRRLPGTGRAGFTMVEIALCLGVIAIALVAIIGVLPTGLRVQQENREDTILNQDGRLLIDLMRTGRMRVDPRTRTLEATNEYYSGADFLTNHVIAVAVSNRVDGALVVINPFLAPNGRLDGAPLSPFGPVPASFNPANAAQVPRGLTNGLIIVGLLSRQKYESRVLGGSVVLVTNEVAALVRSVSGNAADRAEALRPFAFTYLLTSEVLPLGNIRPGLYPAEWINYAQSGLTPEQFAVRSNRFMSVINADVNFSELRLTLNGPVFEVTRNGVKRWRAAGPGSTFRTMLSGRSLSFQVDPFDTRFVVSYLQPGSFERKYLQ